MSDKILCNTYSIYHILLILPYHKKGTPQGVYFPNAARLVLRMPPAVSDPETRRAITHLIEYYNRSQGEGETKTLILADLYLKLGDEPDGQRISLSGLDHVPVLRDFGEPAGLIPLAEMERDYLEKVLNATHWKVSGRNGAAAILGLKPTTLFFRMKKLGLRK